MCIIIIHLVTLSLFKDRPVISRISTDPRSGVNLAENYFKLFQLILGLCS
jgi:hypothetical protein